jgi:ABC-type glycerol-3-phosphate transport system substrate-binding protein
MKKGKIIRSLSVMLASVLLLGTAPACNRKKEGANVLEIFCWKAGYGTQWCKDMYKAFEQKDWVKEKYPDLEIVYSQNDSTNTYITQLDAGEGVNTMDLIFSGGVSSYTGVDAEGHAFLA